MRYNLIYWEVLVSPVVEACPSDNKEKAMSILHSFYCWGYARVVLISTLFFSVAGIENWKILAVIWAGGDIGCSGGPTLVGMVSGALGDDLKMGVLAGVIFPVLLLVGIFLCRKGSANVIKK